MVKSLDARMTQDLKNVTVQVDLCDRQRIEAEKRLNQTLIDQSLSVEKALTISQRLKEEIDSMPSKNNDIVKPITAEVKDFKEKVEAVIAQVQREISVKVNEVQSGTDKQMGEICIMIEELAKVVRSFETQISNVKALNENILSTKLDAAYVHDFEKLVQAQISLAV